MLLRNQKELLVEVQTGTIYLYWYDRSDRSQIKLVQEIPFFENGKGRFADVATSISPMALAPRAVSFRKTAMKCHLIGQELNRIEYLHNNQYLYPKREPNSRLRPTDFGNKTTLTSLNRHGKIPILHRRVSKHS